MSVASAALRREPTGCPDGCARRHLHLYDSLRLHECMAAAAGAREDGLVLGRGDECHIQMDSLRFASMLSREHCRITYSDGGWAVGDLRSRNGTAVNGKRVKKSEGPERLQHGDIICFGAWQGSTQSDACYRFSVL